MKIPALLATTVALGFAWTAWAQSSNPHMGHGSAPSQGQTSTDGAKAAFEAANMRMHKDMDIPYSGNSDVDFARGMIPHHQGAVDMARIELQYGKDPELKRMAQDIISSQEKEITFLRAWLKKNAP